MSSPTFDYWVSTEPADWVGPDHASCIHSWAREDDDEGELLVCQNCGDSKRINDDDEEGGEMRNVSCVTCGNLRAEIATLQEFKANAETVLAAGLLVDQLGSGYWWIRSHLTGHDHDGDTLGEALALAAKAVKEKSGE